FRRSGLGEVEQPVVPSRNLDTFVSEGGNPFADRRETIERRGVSGELRQEYRRALDHASHDPSFLLRTFPPRRPLSKKGKRSRFPFTRPLAFRKTCQRDANIRRADA